VGIGKKVGLLETQDEQLNVLLVMVDAVMDLELLVYAWSLMLMDYFCTFQILNRKRPVLSRYTLWGKDFIYNCQQKQPKT
jgi:hypothetical protein